MLETDANKLREIFRFDPDRQSPLVERTVIYVADAYARHAQSVLIGIERTDRLPESLADPIATVGTDSYVDPNFSLTRVEAHGVIGRRKHDAFNARAICGLKKIVATHNVGLVDRLPRPFDRIAPEMHNAVDPGGDVLDLPVVRKISGNELLIRVNIGGFSYVADPDARISAVKQLAQSGSNVSGSAGNQNGLHESLVHSTDGICYGLFRTVLSRKPLIALATV